jgi:hypothetical protein
MTKRNVRAPASYEMVVKHLKSKRRRGRLTQKDREDLVQLACTPIGHTKQVRFPKEDKIKLHQKAYLMGVAFFSKFSQYNSTRPYDAYRVLDEKKQRMSLCARAAAQADILNAPYGDYVEAQFYWFDDYFVRSPRLTEIASPGAVTRYTSWKELRQKKRVTPEVIHPAVVTGKIYTKKEFPEEMRKFEEQVLERMIRQWGSEQEVWEMCGEPEDQEVFSDAFKRTRAIWRGMYE